MNGVWRNFMLLLALVLAPSIAAAGDAWDDTVKPQLQSVAETYAKWGITFQANPKSSFGGETGPFPSHFDVSGSLDSDGELTMKVGAGFGGQGRGAADMNGTYKFTDTGVTSQGSLSVEAGGDKGSVSFSGRHVSQLSAQVQEGLETLGCQIGQDDKGPVTFGFKALGFSVTVDPLKYGKHLAEVAPQAAEHVKFDLGLMAAAVRNSPITDAFRRQRDDADRLGGILLTTSIDIADGLRPTALHLSNDKVFAATAASDLEIQGLRPQTLAVLLRCVVLAGQPAGLSIGTQASDRDGFLRVSYIGPIRDTPVARTLLAADIRLKGLLMRIGLGAGGAAVPDIQDFAWTFPKLLSGTSCRIWLSGSQVKLVRDGRTLAVASDGLHLEDVFTFRGQMVSDPELIRFTDEFNRRWPRIAQAVPEFQNLRELALAAALAGYVANSHCQVDPELWLYPYDAADTPDFVPSAVAVNTQGIVCGSGGISLSGEAQEIPLGSLLGISAANQMRPHRGIWAALLALMCLLPILPLIRRPLARGLPAAMLAWLAILIALGLVMLAVAEFLFPLLNPFDGELLALLLTIPLPYILVRWIFRKMGRAGRFWTWIGCPLAAAMAMLSLGVISVAADAMLMPSHARWTAQAARACRLASAPLEVAARPVISRLADMPILTFQPRSLVRSTLFRFEVPGSRDRLPSDVDEVPVVSPIGIAGQPGQFTIYRRVSDSPGFRSRQPIFTLDGTPPY